MGCITCGGALAKREKDAIKLYKADYEANGTERYVYRLAANAEWQITLKKYFNVVFVEQIKPNLKKGAEYFHISEYTGS